MDDYIFQKEIEVEKLKETIDNLTQLIEDEKIRSGNVRFQIHNLGNIQFWSFLLSKEIPVWYIYL